MLIHLLSSGVTLLFEPLPSRTSEIEHFEIFRRPRENKLARRFLAKFTNSIYYIFEMFMTSIYKNS